MAKPYIKLKPIEDGTLIRIPFRATGWKANTTYSIYLSKLINGIFKALDPNVNSQFASGLSGARIVGLIFPQGEVETMSGKNFENSSPFRLARAKFSVTEPTGEWTKVVYQNNSTNGSWYYCSNDANLGTQDVTITKSDTLGPYVNLTLSTEAIAQFTKTVAYIDIMVRFSN